MRPSPRVYVFYTPIGKEVIKDISVVENDGGSKKSKKERGNDSLVDMTLTKNSGKLGVLSWINCYLERESKAPVSEDHPVVGTIWQWVEGQYRDGREDPISDEEMLTHVTQMSRTEN